MLTEKMKLFSGRFDWLLRLTLDEVPYSITLCFTFM